MEQRDFLLELEDAKKITSVSMQEFASNLPAATALTPGDIARALNLDEETVRGYIHMGHLAAFKSPADGKGVYKIARAEALDFYKRNLTIYKRNLTK